MGRAGEKRTDRPYRKSDKRAAERLVERELDLCHFCGRPIGFYGCPTHGTDCYPEDDPDLH